MLGEIFWIMSSVVWLLLNKVFLCCAGILFFFKLFRVSFLRMLFCFLLNIKVLWIGYIKMQYRNNMLLDFVLRGLDLFTGTVDNAVRGVARNKKQVSQISSEKVLDTNKLVDFYLFLTSKLFISCLWFMLTTPVAVFFEREENLGRKFHQSYTYLYLLMSLFLWPGSTVWVII